MSKSLEGFTSYFPPLLGWGGMIVAMVIMIFPFVLFALISCLIPPGREEFNLRQWISFFRKSPRIAKAGGGQWQLSRSL